MAAGPARYGKSQGLQDTPGDPAIHALYRVAVEVSRSRDPGAVARIALDLACSQLQADGGAVFAWDASTGMLQPIQETESSSHEPPTLPGSGAIGMAFQDREPVVVDDYQTWEHRLVESAARGMVSAIAVPLVSEDETVGAVGVWTYEPRRFGSAEVELLQVLAGQMAPALEAARLVAEARLRSRIFEALHELALAAASGLNPVELGDIAVRSLAELLGVAGAGLHWMEHQQAGLRPIARTDRLGRPWPHGTGEAEAVREAFDTRRPRLVERPLPDPGSEPEALATAAVPIVLRNRARGVVSVWTYEPRHFSTDDVQLLALFAGQVGPAIEAAQLMEQIQSQAASFRILHDLAVAAAGVFEPGVLAQRTVRYARELVGADDAAIAVWDEDGASFQTLADTSDSPIIPRRTEGVVGAAMRSKRPAVVEDYETWELARPDALAQGIKSVAAIPLLVGDRAIGVLHVRSYSSIKFPTAKVQLLSLLASQAGPAMEAARLVQERQSQAEVFRALHEVAVAAGGVLEPKALAELAVERAVGVLGVESAGLYWWDPESGLLSVLAAHDRGGRRAGPLRPGEGVAGQAFQRVAPVVVDSYADWEHAADAWREAGYMGALGVPLLVSDRPVGAMAVLAKERLVLAGDATRLLSLLAAQVAPALEAARLHTQMVSSEERFRTLFETIACGVLVQGAAGEVLLANQFAEEVFGLGLEQMRGRPAVELWKVYGEDGVELAPEQRPSGQALAGARNSRNQTVMVERLDGERRWLLVDAVPLRIGEKAAEVVSTFTDITERKRVEAALRESEQRFRTVFDRAAIGIVRVDLKSRIIESNPALNRMFGYQDGELDGRPVEGFMVTDDRQRRVFARLGSKGHDVVQTEVRFRAKSGGVVWANVIASLVRDDSGRPLFVIGMVEDITERKAQEAALAHQALHDALTDLPNRVLLTDRINQAIRGAERNGNGVALMFMDLDRFKEVNDTFGHHSGDALLRQVATRLRGRLRGSDTVARLGGDEFALVLPGAGDRETAAQAAVKILESLEAPFTIEGERLHVGASIGIALHPDHGTDSDTLMRRADVAMYMAKRAGRGYAVYAAEADRHSASRLALQSELREAIAGGGLELHYQPKIRLLDGSPVGVEALVRWAHPNHGAISPDEFIPLAESAGLIQLLGAWAIETAVRQARDWMRHGLEVQIAVNLSMRNLQDEQLPEVVARQLARHEVPARLLQVEITESTLMAEPARSMAVLTRLAELGVQCAIDDFGTGYSSLAYLRDLPASEIKIDRSFVTDMARDPSDAVIVRSIIDLGHNLGLAVVAEGVEDAATLELLVAGNCDFAQGYLIGKPEAAGDVLRMLQVPGPAHRQDRDAAS